MEQSKSTPGGKRRHVLLISVMAIVLVITLAANIGMNMFASLMDDYLGKGERHVVKSADLPDSASAKWTIDPVSPYQALHDTFTVSEVFLL